MPISIDLEENPFLLGLIQRGEKRGEERGVKQGEVTLLRRLLEKRFGTLPAWVDTRLEQASTEQLETWSVRILEVSCLDEMFS